MFVDVERHQPPDRRDAVEWVQEEPLNMGAASFLQMNLKTLNFGIISRSASASTATGYGKVHKQEQDEIIETAFTICEYKQV